MCIRDRTPVEVTGTDIDPSCNNANGTLNGTIDIFPVGGTPPYTFDWNGPNTDQTAQNQTGLGEGDYTVVVTDATGLCTTSISFTLEEPEAIDIAETEVDPSCNNADGAADGSITIEVSGGTAPYTFDWNGPGTVQTSQNQTGLGDGTYTVVVTDATGLCTYTETYTLEEPESMDIAETEVDPSCNSADGAADGSITIEVSGGVAPYTYDWQGPITDPATSQNQTGLGAGTYTVVVTDATGLCTYSETYTLEEPEAIDIAETLGAPTCNTSNGDLTGTITIEVSGGTAPYTFAWTGPGVNPTSQNQVDLGDGTYTVIVTDATGLCTYTETYMLDEPQPLDIAETLDQPDCNAANTDAVDGSITIVVSGGTAPYTYEWSGPGTVTADQNQTGLGTGDYTVIVTDNNNCTYTETYRLDEPPFINILAVANPLTCHIDSYDPTSSPDGSITLQVTGGTPGYTFNWDGTGVVVDAQDQTGLTAGDYSVTVTDMNNCTFEQSWTITQPDPVAVVGEVEPLLCNADSGAPTGEIDITPSGGTIGATGIYNYEWETTDGSGLTAGAEDQTGLSAGTYTVTVTDNVGCIVVESWTLTEPEAVVCSLDATDILCNGDLSTITVTPGGGTAPYTYILTGDADFPEQPSNEFMVGAGTYTVTTIDANGCESTCDITIDEPTQLVAGTCVVQDECQLDAGEIQVCAEEGVGPYIVTWISNTGGTLDQVTLTINASGECVTFTGAQGGETYEFTVTDANGCRVP